LISNFHFLETGISSKIMNSSEGVAMKAVKARAVNLSVDLKKTLYYLNATE
jgi:hypothetical protein